MGSEMCIRDSDEVEALEAFLPQFYLGERALNIPSEVIVSQSLESGPAIADAVKIKTGCAFSVVHNVKTHRAKWLAMAVETARSNLMARVNSVQIAQQKFDALQMLLDLDEELTRIECFDISHSHGERTVASCVVFDATGPVKAEYRRFNIKDVKAGDDYAAMEQALTRRYSRLQSEEKALPSLVLIDGGKGQLSKAKTVKADLGIHQVMLLGVAKGITRKPGLETLVKEDGSEMSMQGDEPALHLIQQIRDEAHRFAITGHKNARDKARKRSTLEDIPGVGPTRRRELINHFGGLSAVRKASVDDIARVPGISKKLAQEVYSVLHSE